MKKQDAHTQNNEQEITEEAPESRAVQLDEALDGAQEISVSEDLPESSENTETPEANEESSEPSISDVAEGDTSETRSTYKEPNTAGSDNSYTSIQQIHHTSHTTNTHARTAKEKRWPKMLGLAAGVLAVVLLLASAFLSQYYKGKAMPGVAIANTGINAKDASQIRDFLQPKVAALTVTLNSKDVHLTPTFEEIGLQVDTDATVANALQAKRHKGLLTTLAFWKKQQVPVVTTIDTVKFTQYIETNLPALSKPPTDSQLVFDTAANQFTISEQADGEGVAVEALQAKVTDELQQLVSPNAEVSIEKRVPKITKKVLEPLVAPATELTKRFIVLSGMGYTFQAQPADIAAWVTPTPQDDGSMKLVVDQSKIQAYVEAVGKRISQSPQDRKVLATTTGEVVLQTGRDGTELADRQQLAKAIAIALKEKRDITQQMNIQVAAFKTINMEAYNRWIEVDLSEQRTTLYNGATPLQSFVISSGLPQFPTVTGEFKVWHKNATQTMTGGSRATGDYYNLPNVTWVTYFYQDYGFHTAYWHNSFGQPMSHGCVNMREADAKVVYDFAPIGTTVIVHQ